MSEISNYIPISRKIFEHRFWCEDREYSRFEAWIDLIQSARFEDGKKYIGNKVLHLKRGQIHASIRFLADRWGWSTKRVLGFLELLYEDEMAIKETHKETGHTVITICKYDSYNFHYEKWKQDGNTKETPRKQEGNETNKDNKENNSSSDGADGPLMNHLGLVKSIEDLRVVLKYPSRWYDMFGKTTGMSDPEHRDLWIDKYVDHAVSSGREHEILKVSEAQRHCTNYVRNRIAAGEPVTFTTQPKPVIKNIWLAGN